MALNPFFLQGSQSEQRLVQSLVNEHLRMYGVEVIYIPRKFVKRDTIFREIQSSKFDDNYAIEAYVNTYDGYAGAGDIMTKFGLSLRDELIVTISKERFEDFIAPFLESEDDDEIVLSSRPREGDLVYFPLGQRIFEVKFVEHENPFYQLGKNYVYELKCELFEYEDEVLNTSIEEIDTQIEEEGFITTLKLVGVGATADASASINNTNGYVRQIFLNNDGSGYTSTPTITFSAAPPAGSTATAVAITTSIAGVRSIKEILLTNAGFGYTVPPTIYITGGNGVGAAATCSIETVKKGVISVSINDHGVGYTSVPIVTIGSPLGVGAAGTVTITGSGIVTSVTISNGGEYYIPFSTVPVTFSSPGIGTTAVGIATVGAAGTITSVIITDGGSGYVTPPTISIANTSGNKSYGVGLVTATAAAFIATDNTISAIRITNPGIGYTGTPTVTIQNPSIITGIGTYKFNEVVIGSTSKTQARVKSWDANTKTLKVSLVGIGTTAKGFYDGEILVGSASSARYSVDNYDHTDPYDKYSENDEIEAEADLIIDFSQSNPFGSY